MNGICAGGTGSLSTRWLRCFRRTHPVLMSTRKITRQSIRSPRAAACSPRRISSLINEGATKEDLSASIFQAVVNQTISGLACGQADPRQCCIPRRSASFSPGAARGIYPHLNLGPDQIIAPDHSHLFAAIGAAMNSESEDDCQPARSIFENRLSHGIKMDFEVKRMEPLFTDEADYEDFKTRHASHDVKKGDLATYEGNCYLGIDAGSTTTKVALVGEAGSLLYRFYSNNNGSPLATANPCDAGDP